MATMLQDAPTVKAGPDVWSEPAGWLTSIPALMPEGDRVDIRGRAYIVNALPDGDEGERVLSVVKVSSLAAYEVARQLDGSVTCTCPGGTYTDRCKHAIWAMASGRLAPRPVPWTIIGGESSRLADRPADPEPLPPVAGGSPEAAGACCPPAEALPCAACLPPAAAYLAIADVMVEVEGDPPASERLGLAAAVACQAAAYRAHNTAFGDLMAEHIEALATDLWFFKSATPAAYRRDLQLARDREYELIRAAEDAAAMA